MKPVRRSQAISPFGIGAIVDFSGPASLVHAGLDAWPDPNHPDHREFRIDDERRLANRLGVDFFMLPPDYRTAERGADQQPNLRLNLPFLRFPLWHVCPVCGRMHKAKFHDAGPPFCVGRGPSASRKHDRRKTVQVRFVAACQNGHMQDIPWLKWLKMDDEWEPDSVDSWLRLQSTGSAGTDGILLIAEELQGNGEVKQIKSRSLAGITTGEPGGRDSPLSSIGVRCTGQNPALAKGDEKDYGCGDHLFVFLRGQSNLYFASPVTSIYVPEISAGSFDEAVLDLLEDHNLRQQLIDLAIDTSDGLIPSRKVERILKRVYPQSKADPMQLALALNKHHLKDVFLENGKVVATFIQLVESSEQQAVTPEIVKSLLDITQPDWNIEPEHLVPQLQDWYSKNRITGARTKTDTASEETIYRRQEYLAFCRDGAEGTPKTNLLVKSAPIDSYGSLISNFFDRIALVHKLRETRAFNGFSRIFSGGFQTDADRWGLIALNKKNWLPAIVVRGEGIFLRFRISAIADWESRWGEAHMTRLEKLNQTLADLRTRRRQPSLSVTPRLVLLHTFAHQLINQLVFDCGYGSASLRERIYYSDDQEPMAGVLIYTAESDSEGSMGGLVHMGQPGLLDKVVARAVDRSRWCSSDPVCIETYGQGPDNCNLAACHACALLPETSCEQQNRLLDRGVVSGTLMTPGSGFFQLYPTD